MYVRFVDSNLVLRMNIWECTPWNMDYLPSRNLSFHADKSFITYESLESNSQSWTNLGCLETEAVLEEVCCAEHAILISKSFLFVSGYFWHITDIHYDVHYSTSGDTRTCEYQVRIAPHTINTVTLRMWIYVVCLLCGLSRSKNTTADGRISVISYTHATGCKHYKYKLMFLVQIQSCKIGVDALRHRQLISKTIVYKEAAYCALRRHKCHSPLRHVSG
jgi:hypothetical protein